MLGQPSATMANYLRWLSYSGKGSLGSQFQKLQFVIEWTCGSGPVLHIVMGMHGGARELIP